MTAARIYQLASWLPQPMLAWLYRELGPDMSEASPHTRQLSGFLGAYSDLGWGWKFARTCAVNRMALPAIMDGDDQWVYRAWLHNLSPDFRDVHVGEAETINCQRSRMRATSLQSGLLAVDGKDVTIDAVARDLGVHPDTVRAYEKLFFNIIDRKREAGFIAHIVYPEGRLVELMDGYLRREQIGRFINRTAFNNGWNHAKYFIGLQLHGLLGMDQNRDLSQNFQQTLLAHAYFLAANGLIHQTQDVGGLRAGQRLVTAAQQGGSEAINREISPFEKMGLGAMLGREMLARWTGERRALVANTKAIEVPASE